MRSACCMFTCRGDRPLRFRCSKRMRFVVLCCCAFVCNLCNAHCHGQSLPFTGYAENDFGDECLANCRDMVERQFSSVADLVFGVSFFLAPLSDAPVLSFCFFPPIFFSRNRFIAAHLIYFGALFLFSSFCLLLSLTVRSSFPLSSSSFYLFFSGYLQTPISEYVPSGRSTASSPAFPRSRPSVLWFWACTCTIKNATL